MSFKYQAQKVGDAHYVLPRCGTMKVEAHAFISEPLFEASEEQLWRQLASGASYDGVTGAYLMPDCHPGFGIPTGCVLITDKTLIQAGSGYDISCGVLYLKVNLSANSVRSWDKRERWVQEVEKRISTGKNSFVPNMRPSFNSRQV